MPDYAIDDFILSGKTSTDSRIRELEKAIQIAGKIKAFNWAKKNPGRTKVISSPVGLTSTSNAEIQEARRELCSSPIVSKSKKTLQIIFCLLTSLTYYM